MGNSIIDCGNCYNLIKKEIKSTVTIKDENSNIIEAKNDSKKNFELLNNILNQSFKKLNQNVAFESSNNNPSLSLNLKKTKNKAESADSIKHIDIDEIPKNQITEKQVDTKADTHNIDDKIEKLEAKTEIKEEENKEEKVTKTEHIENKSDNIPKVNNTNQNTDTPFPVEYDTAKCPGTILPESDQILITNSNVYNTQSSLTEFIIEEKELIADFKSFNYKPSKYNIKYSNGDRYFGYFSPNWTKEIFGILDFKGGNHYEGQFKADLFEGRGRLIFNQGDYYEGEFKQDKANGYGKYVNTDGEIYVGYWKDDKQNGQGELLLKDGSRYEGTFVNGMKDGEGRITWPDTSFYVGHFAENYYEGFGCYRMRNEKLYKGRKFL